MTTELIEQARDHWFIIYAVIAMAFALTRVRKVATTRDRIGYVVFAPLWIPFALIFYLVVKLVIEVILDAIF